MGWHELSARRLIRILNAEQLELFAGWRKKCEALGVPVGYAEQYAYLRELKEAA